MVDPDRDPLLVVWRAAMAFCNLARAMDRRARRWEKVAKIWWTRLRAASEREKVLQQELEKARSDFNDLHRTLWKRIDETREKGRTDLLKISQLQEELSMSKKARQDLRNELDALREASEKNKKEQ